MTNSKKKQIAEKLYVFNDLPQKQIAADLGVSEKTISKWKTDGKWDDLKAAHTTGTDELIKALINESNEITKAAREEKRRLTSKEVDCISKNTKAVATLQKGVTMETVMTVFKRYNKWLVDVNPELAAANTEYQTKFLYTISSDE